MTDADAPARPADIEEGAAPAVETVSVPRAELEALRAAAWPFAPECPDAGPRVEANADASSRELAVELAAKDRRIAELEEACKAAVRDREVANALTGRALASGAAAQLVKLWRDEFDVHERDGAYRVSSRDGRDVAKVVGEWLSSADYAHFCLPSSRGGSGARDASRPVGTPSAAVAPRNLGEAVVNKWREESAARPEGLPRPIGLRRQR